MGYLGRSPTAALSSSLLQDADKNTKVQVEESSNENKIRFDTNGTQHMELDALGKLGLGTAASTHGKLYVVNTTAGQSAGMIQQDVSGEYGLVVKGSGTGNTPTLSIQNGSAANTFMVEDNGEVTCVTGDLVFGTAGKGVCLGVTSNTDANTLDDYEEGTWTGTLEGTTTDPTATITATGYYCKIGTFVHIAINFGTHDTSGAVGMPFISGLPHMPLGNPGGFPTGNCMTYGSRYSWGGQIVPYIVNTYIMFYQTVSAGNWGGASFGTAGSGVQLFVTGQYRSSS